MSYFIEICFICLKHSNNLTFISSQNTNETNFEDELKYFLSGLELKSNIPKYICAKCECILNKIRQFKQKCLQNITTYEKYAQQITTTDSSFKHLSVDINPDFIAPISQTELNFEECMIKEEVKELTLDDESKLLLLEIKQEDIIEKNTQISNIENKKDKPHTCKICEKSFKRIDCLKIHQLVHSGEKPLICEVCNKSFRTLHVLKRHELIHSNKKPYTCKICEKSFRQLQHLKYHQIIHSGEKPFTCEICNESFRRLHHLKNHQLIHTGKNTYNCEICNVKFRCLKTLKKHKLVHINK